MGLCFVHGGKQRTQEPLTAVLGPARELQALSLVTLPRRSHGLRAWFCSALRRGREEALPGSRALLPAQLSPVQYGSCKREQLFLPRSPQPRDTAGLCLWLPSLCHNLEASQVSRRGRWGAHLPHSPSLGLLSLLTQVPKSAESLFHVFGPVV